MRAISTLTGMISPEVPGCFAPVIERQTIRTIRDFCTSTHVWQEKSLSATLADGESSVDLDPEAGEVVVVKSVEGGGSWAFIPPATLDFNSAATEDTPLTVEAVMRPKMMDEEAPEWLLDRYEEAITAGVISKLLFQNAQPWFNPEVALIYSARYRSGIGAAKVDLVKKFKGTITRVSPRRGF